MHACMHASLLVVDLNYIFLLRFVKTRRAAPSMLSASWSTSTAQLIIAFASVAAAMPWPKSSVPKFGNWDVNGDVSYSIVFDKVRAEKDTVLHHLDGDFENASSHRSLSPKGNGGISSRMPQSSFPAKITGESKRSSHDYQEDRRFSSLRHNAYRNSEHLAEKGTFCDEIWTRNVEHSGPKFSFWQEAVLNKHSNVESRQFFDHHKADPQNLSGMPTYDPLPVSAFPSRQPKQSGTTKEGRGPYQEHKGFQKKEHTELSNSTSSWRDSFQEESVTAKSWGLHQSLEVPTVSPVQGNMTVPKFGDWEDGNGYTTIFNIVRKERSLKTTLPSNVESWYDEDLYKDSRQSKRFEQSKRRGWQWIICCFKPHSP